MCEHLLQPGGKITMSTHQHDYVQEMNEFRRQKDAFFATSAQSPIPAQERNQFHGLRYFPPNQAYRVQAQLVRFPNPEIVQLGTTTGRITQHYRYAEVRFTLNGQMCRLTAYKSVPEPGHEHHHEDHELFLPFRDATTSKESYGAGRYLEVEENNAGPGQLLLDFNLAYSPWCSYSDQYSCVLPPAENTLSVAVRAGEQSYHM
jgi:uncharacterized protein (DUF1684 family)